jgi:hypothetical protein
MKRLISLSLAAGMALPLLADPNWKMHPTFDETITRVVDTPDYTYFLCRTQPYSSNARFASTEYQSLFRYDKEGDELGALSTDNLLSSNVVSKVEYSPQKGFMVVIYTNFDIDLLYDNGEVVNIPSYRLATVNGVKDVNSIFIDADNDRIYLSTDFGYVALNDKKREIAESRLYGTPVSGMTRVGDNLYLLANGKLLEAPLSASRLSIADYKEVRDVANPQGMTWIDGSLSLMLDGSGNQTVYKLTPSGSGVDVSKVTSNMIVNVEPNSLGAIFRTRIFIFQMYADGRLEQIQTDDIDDWLPVGSYNLNEVWFGKMRTGFTSKRYSADSKSWTVTRDYMTPDAPAPFMATEMVRHPERGLLVSNHGYDRNFMSDYRAPVVISAYRNGFWSNVAPTHTAPDEQTRVYSPNGLALDPDNPDIVYVGSAMNGLVRLNLADGTDILQLSRKGDPYRDLPGFVAIVPDQTGANSWKSSCVFGAPKFDYYGNLWTVWGDIDNSKKNQSQLFVWEASDRRASVDAERYRPMKQITINGVAATNTGIVEPLLRSGQRDIVLYTAGDSSGSIVVMNTNGTPSDPEDDTVTIMSSYRNQDGESFTVSNIHCMYEDPQTGTVWVGHDEGVFTFNPANAVDGANQVTKIKVARNDGTNLADFLLNLVPVNRIITDGQGRKWFATKGAGAVCTSSDGKTVYQSLTTANSPLSSDNVWGIGYVSTNNSILFSTEAGISEYYMTGSASTSGDMSAVRVYPNPVRPDYFGYVTIDGLPQGALVKIVDSGGNLVKELGIASGGEAKWDVTNTAFKRVSSGVYFVLSSTDENGGSLSNVGKVLVIN